MSSSGQRPSARSRRRAGWRHPLAIIIGLAILAGILALALPPIVRFAAFLFAGDVWRALTGVALISLLAGFLLVAVVGGASDRRRSPSDAGAIKEDRSRAPLWTLVWILLVLVPVACILVALIASGALLDIIEWVGDRISEIRGAQSS